MYNSMQEIEIKVLKINKNQLTRQLLALGAKRLGTRFVIEKSFDFKNGTISNHKNLLRLRRLGETVELVYKSFGGKSGKFKIMEETQTEVKNFKIMEKILEKIGLRCIKHREKKRTSFHLGAVQCEIDEYPQIPPYLEIEGSKKDILNTLNKLGIPFSETTSMSATQVLKKYRVAQNFLKFRS